MRRLTAEFLKGGPKAFDAFRDLAQVLLSATVLDPSSYVRYVGRRPRTGRETRALGGPRGPTDPVLLRDGRYLRVAVSLFLDGQDPRGRLLKVLTSSYQYQTDPVGDQWIWRYDYLREPGPDPHPTAHLQIRGALTEPVLATTAPLDRVHFPTGRVALEAVIRLLIEQFGVPTRDEPAVWRALLTASEGDFQKIAHQPQSGPSR